MWSVWLFSIKKPWAIVLFRNHNYCNISIGFGFILVSNELHNMFTKVWYLGLEITHMIKFISFFLQNNYLIVLLIHVLCNNSSLSMFPPVDWGIMNCSSSIDTQQIMDIVHHCEECVGWSTQIKTLFVFDISLNDFRRSLNKWKNILTHSEVFTWFIFLCYLCVLYLLAYMFHLLLL